MNIASSISLSGMQAAQSQLQASAHNLANLETQNFTRQEITQSTTPAGGVQTAVQASSVPGSNPEADMVQQQQSKYTYLANLSVFKSNNDMLGTLLNISA